MKKSEVRVTSERSQNEVKGQNEFNDYCVQKKFQSLLEGENREEMKKDMKEQEKVVRQMGEAIQEKVKRLVEQKVQNCIGMLEERQRVVNNTDSHLMELFKLGLPEDQLGSRLQQESEQNDLVQLTRIYL